MITKIKIKEYCFENLLFSESQKDLIEKDLYPGWKEVNIRCCTEEDDWYGEGFDFILNEFFYINNDELDFDDEKSHNLLLRQKDILEILS